MGGQFILRGAEGIMLIHRPSRLPHPFDTGSLSNCLLKRRAFQALRKAEPKDESTRLLEEDMQRYSKMEGSYTSGQNSQSQEQAQSSSSIKDLLDKLLIGDFFFVLLALAWLSLGVVEKGTLSSTKLLDTWFPLWALVFQPAIGVLMLGSLISGGLGWLKSKQAS